VLNQLPSPKLQFQTVGVPPVDRSVNNTASGTIPDEIFVENETASTGDVVMLIVLPSDIELLPGFETAR
jgi:hypothetical protein